jgi:hypothetical protein
MPISVKVAGHINLGTGVTYHTDYRLEVCVNEKRWTVYRRYKAFEDLHEGLAKTLGETAFAVQFLDKQYMGSYVSTLKAFTDERMAKLQQYLDSIIVIEDVVETKHFTDFLDCDHLGASGVVKELGAERVLKQAFVMTRVTKSLPPALGIWCVRYVVLLNSGSLIVLGSMYDDSTKAIVRMAMVNGQTTVVPQASNNSINISSTLDKTKISLNFPESNENVFWLRKLSDFVLNTEFSEDHQKKTASEKAAAAARDQAAREASAVPAEHVRARGTGKTEDQLSSTLGI